MLRCTYCTRNGWAAAPADTPITVEKSRDF